MILTVGGIKGGSGKSTIATNLACLAAALPSNILLMDADDQESAWDFSVIRKTDHPTAPHFDCKKVTAAAVRNEVRRLAPKYDYIIIDTGGRDTTSQRAALSVSDFLLVPFLPRTFDIWTIEKVAHLIEEFRTVNPNLIAYGFLSQADPGPNSIHEFQQGTENEDAARIIKKEKAITFLNTPLIRRKAYAHATGAGLAVTELMRYRNPKANAEILTLFQRCFKTKQTLQAAG